MPYLTLLSLHPPASASSWQIARCRMRASERSKLGRSASGAGEAGDRSNKQKIHGTSSSCILQRQINHSLNPGLAIRGVTCLSPDSGSSPEEWDSGLVTRVRFWVRTGGGLLVCSDDALEPSSKRWVL